MFFGRWVRVIPFQYSARLKRELKSKSRGTDVIIVE